MTGESGTSLPLSRMSAAGLSALDALPRDTLPHLRLGWASGLRRGVAIAGWTAFHALRAGDRYLRQRLTGRTVSKPALLGEFLAATCESLGAAFIKLGQILSSRPDLLPGEVIEPLRRLQDRVAAAEARAIVERIETTFKRPLEASFPHFDPRPIASASIAQVHVAQLADGRRVAVKVRRPGVGRQIVGDLQLLRWVAARLGRLRALRLLPFVEMVDEIGTAVESQLDFVLEARNNRRFRDHFYGVDRIRFPALIEDYCADAVLTMEYLDDLEKVDTAQIERALCEKAAVAGLRALYKMIFLDGFIHADLHPGNVFLRAEGEMVMLDTGLVAELAPADRRQFVDFFLGMVTNNGGKCARVVEETAFALAESYDRQAFEADMRQLIGRHSALKASDFEVTTFVFQLFNLQRQHGIRGATAFTMTLLSLVVYEGIVKQLHPDLDFQREARGYLIAAKYRRQ